jgi:hypothetical protein
MEDHLGGVELAERHAALELGAGYTDLVGMFQSADALCIGRGNRRCCVHAAASRGRWRPCQLDKRAIPIAVEVNPQDDRGRHSHIHQLRGAWAGPETGPAEGAFRSYATTGAWSTGGSRFAR